MNKSAGIGIIALLLVFLGGWYWSSSLHRAPALATSPARVNQDTATPQVAQSSATITYTASGFSPKTITIKEGGTVTFVEQGGGKMWVASDPHPAHTIYAGTSRAQHCPDTTGVAFDQCTDGASYSFTFQHSGNWNYHNHVNANDVGIIIVVP